MSNVAARQWGVISWRQLRALGLNKATISDWCARGRLHRIHPGVYALGHRRLPTEGLLVAALLYAGPGAALSHVTAAWWWRLIEAQPERIDVSAPGYRRSLPSVRVHHPRRLEQVRYRSFPVTPLAQTVLDFSAAAPLDRVRRVLAEADYLGLLDLDALDEVLGRGHSGSAKVRRALADHRPELALTRSELELAFVALCERGRIPMPEINARVCGITVDALWRDQRVVVELDGLRAHNTPERFERDHRRDLRLRRAGFLVLRYTWLQLTRELELVTADVQSALLARSA